MQKLTLRGVIIKLTGLLFAAYAAYNVFIIFRDLESLSVEGIIISAAVALMFVLLTVYAWTSRVKVKDVLFRMIRRWMLILVLVTILGLKLRIVGDVIAYVDGEQPYTVLNAAAYFLTLAGLLVILAYYVFFRMLRPIFPIISIVLPLTAVLFLLGGLVTEMVMYFAYDVGLEANVLRTLVMRPVFYLCFIGLAVYYAIPPKAPPKAPVKSVQQPPEQAPKHLTEKTTAK